MFTVNTETQLTTALGMMELNAAAILAEVGGTAQSLFDKVRSQYKKLALKYHPDKNKALTAEAKFKEIVNAYEGLAAALRDGTLQRLLSPTAAASFSAAGSSSDYMPPTHHSDVPTTEAQVSISDSTKNALFAYYKARFPTKFAEAFARPGHEAMRQVLSELLGISPMAFNTRPNQLNCGYEIFSCSFSTKSVIEDFISSIGNDYAEELKPVSFEYSVPASVITTLCGHNVTAPDLVSIRVKQLLRLSNTSQILCEHDSATGQYHIFISSSVASEARQILERQLGGITPTRNPIRTAMDSVGSVTTEGVLTVPANTVALSGLKIQVAFALDATGSMSSMLGAAKKGLQAAGAAIQKANNGIEPEMSFVTYFDYGDHGKPLSGYTAGDSSGGYFSRSGGGGDAVYVHRKRGESDENHKARLTEMFKYQPDETEENYIKRVGPLASAIRTHFGEGLLDQVVLPFPGEATVAHAARCERIKNYVAPAAASGKPAEESRSSRRDGGTYSAVTVPVSTTAVPAPQEGTLQALNYPGKREQGKLPTFTTPLVVSNMLSAVMAGGGGDVPEMLEAALAVTTQLPWSAPVQTMYVALDAPPHVHYTGASGDHQSTLPAVRTEQQKLRESDPCLLNAVTPEDWIAQTIILSRKGIVINPMICGGEAEVAFFAAFTARLSGGTAVFLDNAAWNDQLESYIEKNTRLDIEEIGYTPGSREFNDVQERRAHLLTEAKVLKRPSQAIDREITAVMDQIRSVVYDPTISVPDAAQRVRAVYEVALRRVMGLSTAAAVEIAGPTIGPVHSGRADAIHRRRDASATFSSDVLAKEPAEKVASTAIPLPERLRTTADATVGIVTPLPTTANSSIVAPVSTPVINATTGSAAAGMFAAPSPDVSLKADVMRGLAEISRQYGEGPHKSKLSDLITVCETECTVKAQLKNAIDKLTAVGGGLGNGRLNAALVELSKEISSGERIDTDYLGRLAVNKSATKTTESVSKKF